MRKEVRGKQGIDDKNMLEKFEKLEKMLIEQNYNFEKMLIEQNYNFEKIFEKMSERDEK